jgi:hypothetical protein
VIRTDLDHRRAKAQIAAVIDAASTRPARAWPRRWPLRSVTAAVGTASKRAGKFSEA